MSRESFSICILLSLLVLLIPGSIAATAQDQDLTILSSCQSHCGRIAIPYPFGIGKDCYLNNWYEVICNQTSGNPVPILNSINREVVNISLPDTDESSSYFGVIRIKNPVTSFGCSNTDELISLALNVTGSPFFLEAYSPSNITKPELFYDKGYATVELGWFIDRSHNMSVDDTGVCYSITEGTGGWSYSNYEACICRYGKYLEQSYRSCMCNTGYRGNPYLSSGCTDIDECEEAKTEGRNPCRKGFGCENIRGNFRCRSKTNKTLAIILGISLGFGLLVLTIGAWWLYKFIRKQREIKQKKKFFKRNEGLLLQQQLISNQGNVDNTRGFNSKDLEKATENFIENRVLGQGGLGTVYKGMLGDGRIVAVKNSKAVDEDKVEEFINEVVNI